MTIDKDGVLYSGLMSEVQLYCWNTASDDYGPRYWEVVGNNKEALQFASGIKVAIKSKTKLVFINIINNVIVGGFQSQEKLPRAVGFNLQVPKSCGQFHKYTR